VLVALLDLAGPANFPCAAAPFVARLVMPGALASLSVASKPFQATARSPIGPDGHPGLSDLPSQAERPCGSTRGLSSGVALQWRGASALAGLGAPLSSVIYPRAQLLHGHPHKPVSNWIWLSQWPAVALLLGRAGACWAYPLRPGGSNGHRSGFRAPVGAPLCCRAPCHDITRSTTRQDQCVAGFETMAGFSGRTPDLCSITAGRTSR